VGKITSEKYEFCSKTKSPELNEEGWEVGETPTNKEQISGAGWESAASLRRHGETTITVHERRVERERKNTSYRWTYI